MTPVNREEIIETTKNMVLNILKQTIRPEFLNRIDDIVMFSPLKEEEIAQIVRLQLEGVRKMLAENGITLKYTDEAVNSISRAGFDPEFGARPVKRVIQRRVLNQLSKDMLAGTVDKSKPIIIDAIDDTVFFRN